MTQHEPAHVALDESAPSRRGRRALIAGAATAAVGALGVAVAKPADAAAGSALLLGRSNASGSSQTVVFSSNTTSAINVRASAGTGVLGDTSSNAKYGLHGRNTAATGGTTGAVRGEGRQNHGVRGDTANANRYGVVAVNSAAGQGTGAAVRASGRKNIGVWADATDDNTPAVLAVGNNGTGVSLFAIGFADIEGGLFALDAQVGIVSGGLVGGTIVEAGVASGTSPWHIHTGTTDPLAAGDNPISLPVQYTDAADVSVATVYFTGRGGSAANIYLQQTSPTDFTLGGATVGQVVDYVVVAPRLDVFSVSLNKAGQAAKRLEHKTTFHDPRG